MPSSMIRLLGLAGLVSLGGCSNWGWYVVNPATETGRCIWHSWYSHDRPVSHGNLYFNLSWAFGGLASLVKPPRAKKLTHLC